MSKPTDIRLLDVTTDTEYIQYRTPIKFGGRVVTDAVLLNVTVRVKTRLGKRGAGSGSMPMGHVWAWPTQNSTAEQTLAAMVELGQRLARQAAAYSEFGHPLEITHDLAGQHQAAADAVISAAGVTEPMPRLAQLVAASPTEAAIHDAYGKALGRNSYDLLGGEFVNRDLAGYLNAEFQGEYLDRYTLRQPKPSMPLYHLVGAIPLTDADVTRRIGDGLPETLPEWIVADGLTHLKIKLAGDDLAWDVQRVLSIDRVAAETQQARGCDNWFYSADFNEKCATVDYVLAFLALVGEHVPMALRRLAVHRTTHPSRSARQPRQSHAPRREDQALGDRRIVGRFRQLALEPGAGLLGRGAEGVQGAQRLCSIGAAAQKYEMFLCVQDLTCPGASFLHSASLAARIPTVAAIEGNSRQYCPAGNRDWAARFPGMFHVADGAVGTSVLNGPGLGF